MSSVAINALRTLAFGGISGTYATVGGTLAQNIRMFRIINNTDGDMIFSIDGTNGHFFVPALSFVLYDLASNSPPQKQGSSLVLNIGTQFYVKQSTAPSKGAVWIECLYATGV